MTFHNVIMLTKSVSNKDKNNYYYKTFLKISSYELPNYKFLYKIYILYYDRTDVSEGSDVNKASESKSAIGIFK